MNNRAAAVVTTAFLLSLTTAPVVAQDDFFAMGEETVRLDFGIFFTDNDTTVRIDESGGAPGSVVNLEDALGLDDDTIIGQASGYWRIARHHRLFLGYYAINRDASQLITGDIAIGDIDVPAGSTVRTVADMSSVPFAWGWSFAQDDNTEVAFLVGGHYADVDLEASAPNLALAHTAMAEGPMPLLGLQWEQAWGSSHRWRSVVTGQMMDLDFDAWDGSFYSVRIAGEYQMSRNFLLGLGYNWFAADVRVEDDNWRGLLDWEYQGIQAYGSLRF